MIDNAPHGVICHECGKEMVRDTREMEYTFPVGSGPTRVMHKVKIMQPAWWCECGEGVLVGEDCLYSDYAIAEYKKTWKEEHPND